jgi:hypothetical protein
MLLVTVQGDLVKEVLSCCTECNRIPIFDFRYLSLLNLKFKPVFLSTDDNVLNNIVDTQNVHQSTNKKRYEVESIVGVRITVRLRLRYQKCKENSKIKPLTKENFHYSL